MAEENWIRSLIGKMSGSGGSRPKAGRPEWYDNYSKAHKKAKPDNRPLSEVPVVILDSETTGLDVKRDVILSLGALRVRGNRIKLTDKFEAYLRTPIGYEDPQAVAIHGIIPNSHRYHYVDSSTLLADLLQYLDTAIIVGHHIGFDVEIINRTLARHGAGPLLNRVVDTVAVAKRLRPAGYWTPTDDYSLDALAKRYRIPLSDRHTALGDCYITAVLWLKLLARLTTKLNRDLTLKDLNV